MIVCFVTSASVGAPVNQSTPVKKNVPQKRAPAVPTPRLGAQPTYKQSYLNANPAVSAANESGEPLPTPNIIENILKTPSPEVVKSTLSLQRYNFKHGCGPVTNSMSDFLNTLYIRDGEFLAAFNRQAPQFFVDIKAKCIPYAYSIDNNTNKILAFSILNNEARDKSTNLVTLHRSPNTDGFIVN